MTAIKDSLKGNDRAARRWEYTKRRGERREKVIYERGQP
jgi:hypothetical protein